MDGQVWSMKASHSQTFGTTAFRVLAGLSISSRKNSLSCAARTSISTGRGRRASSEPTGAPDNTEGSKEVSAEKLDTEDGGGLPGLGSRAVPTLESNCGLWAQTVPTTDVWERRARLPVLPAASDDMDDDDDISLDQN
jgi:hypothetical protein